LSLYHRPALFPLFCPHAPRDLPSFPTRRSSDLGYAAYLPAEHLGVSGILAVVATGLYLGRVGPRVVAADTRVQNSGMWDVVVFRSEEHTSELQSLRHLVCRLLLEKKKQKNSTYS